MRVVNYRQGRGRPTDKARGNLNELVMLLEAAVALANVERWVQKSVAAAAREKAGASILSESIRNAGKQDSYEVSVVDGFMRLGAMSFAAHGSEAVWERTFLTGKRGRPVAVDVCLFSSKRDEEARIEFGLYSLGKLKSDAKKLAIDLSESPGHSVVNFVMLWRTLKSAVVASDTTWRDDCITHAKKASTGKIEVKMEIASEQDMFVAGSRDRNKVQVGLFSVVRGGALTSPTTGSDLSPIDLPL